MSKRFLIAGAICGGTAVALGAFGAHGLKEVLSDENLRVFHTGVEYQFYHALALLFTGLAADRNGSKFLKWAGNLFIAGIILFSGSLYCLSIFQNLMWMGIITPFGGLCFIAGWLLLLIAFMKKS